MRKRWRERNGLYFSLFLRNGCGVFDGGESGGAVEPLTGRKRDAAHGRHGLPDRLARRSLTLAGIGEGMPVISTVCFTQGADRQARNAANLGGRTRARFL